MDRSKVLVVLEGKDEIGGGRHVYGVTSVLATRGAFDDLKAGVEARLPLELSACHD
jgi:hypothetical protein